MDPPDTPDQRERTPMDKATIPKIRRLEERCPHCTGGRVFEPTEDALHDEVHECPMCFGTAKRTTRAEREAIRAGRA